MGPAVLPLSSDFSVPRKKSKVTQTLFYNFTRKSVLCQLMANQGGWVGAKTSTFGRDSFAGEVVRSSVSTSARDVKVPGHKNTFPAEIVSEPVFMKSVSVRESGFDSCSF